VCARVVPDAVSRRYDLGRLGPGDLVDTFFRVRHQSGRPWPLSLNGGDALRFYRALAQIGDHLAREGNPIRSDGLANIFIGRVIQNDAVARSNKGCRQIPSQLDFFVMYRTRSCHRIRLLRWALGAICRGDAKLVHHRAASWYRPLIMACRGCSDMAGKSLHRMPAPWSGRSRSVCL
jgi:hypothetical protein